METFELRSACNTLITDLNDSVDRKNVVNLGIDILLPERYRGNPNELTAALLAISGYLAKILVNGLIHIEISLHSRQNYIINLQLQVTGQGTLRQLESEWRNMEKFLSESDIEIHHKSDNEQICFDFLYALNTLEEAGTEAGMPFNNKQVLIVEDNEINAMVFSTFVEEWGCQSFVAVNGAEAVIQVHDKPFDVILMDIHMPILNGKQATRKIREFSSIPIVALTASTEEGDIQEAMAAGANDYLLKPISSTQLFQVLSKYL